MDSSCQYGSYLGSVGSPNPAKVKYSSSYFKSIGKTQPKQQLSEDLWTELGDLGIRRPFQSKGAGYTCQIRAKQLPTQPFFPIGTSTKNQSLNLTMVVSNVRSILPRINELCTVISNINPPFVCLTETWLHSDVPDSAIDLNNEYISFRKDRTSSRGGGVCVYIKS